MSMNNIKLTLSWKTYVNEQCKYEKKKLSIWKGFSYEIDCHKKIKSFLYEKVCHMKWFVMWKDFLCKKKEFLPCEKKVFSMWKNFSKQNEIFMWNSFTMWVISHI